ETRPLAPTPRALRGSVDPSLRVRPVDWTATGRRPEPDTAASPTGSPSADGATPRRSASPPEGATPSARLPRRRARTVALPRPASPPPPGAVHTLDADDPRPLRRPLRIEDAAIRTVGVDGLASEQIVGTVADPQDAWTADA